MAREISLGLCISSATYMAASKLAYSRHRSQAPGPLACALELAEEARVVVLAARGQHGHADGVGD